MSIFDDMVWHYLKLLIRNLWIWMPVMPVLPSAKQPDYGNNTSGISGRALIAAEEQDIPAGYSLFPGIYRQNQQ